ncbi:hypothetical protein [Rhizobium sp. 2MFCol3.1]|uniref:hypothetical protein n=1 Tax=Rhizobium sp. 2MFCol3.1 TaxID=1246459 RepID=UPI00037E799F|nr:hypothetical protein [Rhizobium sp. 2MFCol3.1]
MQTYTEAQKIQRSAQAKELLNNPAWKETWAEIMDDLVKELVESPLTDDEGRRSTRYELHVAQRFIAKMKERLGDENIMQAASTAQ